MVGVAQSLREHSGESEKITINLGYVDLGRIDLLVQEGFYVGTAVQNSATVAAG